MVSKRQKIAAIIVIIVVVLASFTILLTNYNPQTSKARAMILVADDIIDGTHWYGFFAGDVSSLEPNTTSQAYSHMRNDSILVDIELYVFNNVTNCHASFLNWTSQRPENVTQPSIGHESVYYDQYNSTVVGIVFREVNIIVFVNVETHFVNVETLSGSPWLYGSALSLAELQLQKIDQFLAK